MEAISFGIPVLATDVGGTGEIVIHGENGYLISKDYTDEEFKKAFNLVYKADEESYKKLRSSARKVWSEKFNAEDNYPKFCSLITNTNTINV